MIENGNQYKNCFMLYICKMGKRDIVEIHGFFTILQFISATVFVYLGNSCQLRQPRFHFGIPLISTNHIQERNYDGLKS